MATSPCVKVSGAVWLGLQPSTFKPAIVAFSLLANFHLCHVGIIGYSGNLTFFIIDPMSGESGWILNLNG
jgi:hypothetical protein